MIHFRFHVVSIIAIFLAIAIGTVMGATFVGRGVIDNLQTRIDKVQSNADDEHAQNSALQSQINDANKYIDESAGLTVDRTLSGVRIELIAERGVDGGQVDAQATLLRTAGATVPGIVWLEERWDLTTPEEAAALRTATGLANRSRSSLRSAAAQLLGQRLASPPPIDDVLPKLADAKFVTLTGAAGSATPTFTDFAGEGARILVAGGPSSPVPVSTVTDLAGGAVGLGGPTAIGQVFATTDTVKDRAGWIDPIADTDELRNLVSTIDDLDLTSGRVAATLALAELASGAVGNYGLDRDRAIPDLPVVTAPTAR
jgi:Copper transport outer membrane protein, MctB